MQNQNTKLHETLAHEIKSAKKTMFKSHREGMSAREAADKFCFDMAQRFERLFPRNGEPAVYSEPDPPSSGSLPSTAVAEPVRADWRMIEEWGRTIVAGGDEPEEKSRAFLLLMSEIAIVAHDGGPIMVDNIAATAMQAAFSNTEYAWKARAATTERLRIEAGLTGPQERSSSHAAN